jgi:hypothetical protein
LEAFHCEPAGRFRSCNLPPLPPLNKPLSVAILIVGIILLVFGLNAHDSVASSAKEAVTGTPTDKSLWLIVLGTIGIVTGGFSALFRRNN